MDGSPEAVGLCLHKAVRWGDAEGIPGGSEGVGLTALDQAGS